MDRLIGMLHRAGETSALGAVLGVAPWKHTGARQVWAGFEDHGAVARWIYGYLVADLAVAISQVAWADAGEGAGWAGSARSPYVTPTAGTPTPPG